MMFSRRLFTLKIHSHSQKFFCLNTNTNNQFNPDKPPFKNVAIILSGCGPNGTDLFDAVSLMVNLNKQNVSFSCYSLTNQMEESARISRGKISDLSTLQTSKYQGIFIPGGQGVSHNLTNYHEKSQDYTVDETLKSILVNFHKERKPIVTLGLAGIITANVFAKYSPKITIGREKNLEKDNNENLWPHSDVINSLQHLGVVHVSRSSRNFQIDFENMLISTPASAFAGYKKSIHIFESTDSICRMSEQFYLGNQIRINDYTENLQSNLNRNQRYDGEERNRNFKNYNGERKFKRNDNDDDLNSQF